MNPSRETTFRILDASANRASEGIRTIEEFARFGLDDAVLSQAMKDLRHQLSAALSRLSRPELLRARDTEADVGTEISTTAEYKRQATADVLAAAAGRVQQSLRVLEEYGKTLDVEFARKIESLRYQAYQVHRSIELAASTNGRRDRLAASVLYVLIECMEDESTFINSIRGLSNAGVDIFQLRDKNASDRLLFERAQSGARVAKESGTMLIVNDRADIAVAADADGVHVGQDELPATEARRLVGSDRLVGVSTHNLDQVHKAIASGADYIGCGPTFPSQTKSFDQHTGIDFLKAVHEGTRQTPRPAFAIGGIHRDNVNQVFEAGFHRIAVTAAVSKAPDPVKAAEELAELLARHTDA